MPSMSLLVPVLLCGVVHAAVENITFEPSRQVSSEHSKLLQQIHADFNVTGAREEITELISLIQSDWIMEHVTELSGEAPDSAQTTRWSNSIADAGGVNRACQYVEQRMSLDYGATVEVDYWDSNRGPNIISSFQGTGPNAHRLVILGAHLDDIPSSGRAPGANDDGSGSAALLAIAQAISEYGATFDFTLVLEHYTGEEQGLLGSRALARRRAERGDDVLAMIQQDMTAYFRAGDDVGIAFVEGTAVNAELSALVKSVFNEYTDPTEFVVHDRVLSGSSCCSDHQSYVENGYPSVGLIEPRGYTGDPMYHQAGDLVLRADYSVEQITLTAQGALAAAAVLAGLDRI